MQADVPENKIATRDEWMRRLGPLYPGLVALGQLTRLPVLRGVEPTEDDRLRAAPWFPPIGGLIGALVALVALLLLATEIVPAIGGVLALGTALVLSGGMYEAGLARAADALFSEPSTELAYRQPAIGLGGIAAVSAAIALRVFLLLGIDPQWWIGALIASQIVLRWVPVFLLCLGDRLQEPVLGERSLALGAVSWATLGIGSAFTLACVILFGGGVGVLSLGLAAGFAFGAGVFFQRRYGGLSSHTLAAASVASELLVLLTFAASHAAVTSPWVS